MDFFDFVRVVKGRLIEAILICEIERAKEEVRAVKTRRFVVSKAMKISLKEETQEKRKMNKDTSGDRSPLGLFIITSLNPFKSHFVAIKNTFVMIIAFNEISIFNITHII